MFRTLANVEEARARGVVSAADEFEERAAAWDVLAGGKTFLAERDERSMERIRARLACGRCIGVRIA